MLLSGFHHCCWETRAEDLPDPIIPSSRLPGFCGETEPSVHAADVLPLPPPVPASKSPQSVQAEDSPHQSTDTQADGGTTLLKSRYHRFYSSSRTLHRTIQKVELQSRV